MDEIPTDEHPVERSVTLETSIERAWELITSPDDLNGWLGAEVDLDPKPGAAGHVLDHDGTRRRLVIDEVVPGERISWRWWVDRDSGDRSDSETAGVGDGRWGTSRVAITLTPAVDGTRVNVIEHRLPSASAHAEASAGAGASATAAATVTAGVRRAWSHRLLHLELLALLLVHARV